MTQEKLTIPRRLAIELLAHGQQAAPAQDLLGYLTGTPPASLNFHPGRPTSAEPVWALVQSQDATRDAAAGRVITVGLDTKGVLQLRFWDTRAEPAVEHALEIR